MDARLTFGQWVRQRRKALGLTQQDLAQQISCALSTIQKFELDARQPSKPMAELMAAHLQVDLAERDAFLHLARHQATSTTVATPPLAAPTHEPVYNLPAPVTGLIGREWEVATVCASLLQPALRLLTITGPPGVGKTRLSLAAAYALRHDFADGVCFVALSPIASGRCLPAAILQALELADADGDRQLHHLKTWLRARELLLVLDNFEHLTPAAPLLIELLEAAPALKILVTSRTLLQIYGEHEFVAPPLALPDRKSLAAPVDLSHCAVIDLFVARARAAKLDFTLNDENEAAVAELCTRLDGVPLAIELAATHSKELAPAAILARLQQASHNHSAGLDLLAGGRYLPAHQHTLRETIAWSYDLLSPTEQRVFRCLGIFAGGCTLEALQTVLAHSAYATDDHCAVQHATSTGDAWLQAALHALVNQSLVLQAQGPDQAPRFSLLEMLREYALEQLERQPEAAAVQRAHAEYYLHVAVCFDEAKGEAAPLLCRMATEKDNLRAGLQWASEHDLALELRFAAALAEYCSQRQHLIRAGHITREAAITEDLPLYCCVSDLWGISLSHLGMSEVYFARGNHPHRVAGLEAALLTFRRAGQLSLTVEALCVLGKVRWWQDERNQAVALWQESLALGQAVEAHRCMAEAAVMLGLAAAETGDRSQAQAFYTQSHALYQAVENPIGVAYALCGLASLEPEPGRRGETLAAAAAVLKVTRLPFDAIERAYYERHLAAQLLIGGQEFQI